VHNEDEKDKFQIGLQQTPEIKIGTPLPKPFNPPYRDKR
jgi:hypothetical protein